MLPRLTRQQLFLVCMFSFIAIPLILSLLSYRHINDVSAFLKEHKTVLEAVKIYFFL